MLSKNNLQHEGKISPLDFLRYLLVASVTYWLINFVLSPNTLSPLHQDDYVVLGGGYEKLRWSLVRPVSTNLAYFMGEMGATFFYALANFLTVAVPALVLYFFSRLLGVRIGWLLAIAFSVMTFSHLAAFEHGKYLGLITNLISHFFGCLALIALLFAREKPTLTRGTLAVIAYGLSVFAKEDFLLPPLLLLAYFGAELFYPRTSITLEATVPIRFIANRVARRMLSPPSSRGTPTEQRRFVTRIRRRIAVLAMNRIGTEATNRHLSERRWWLKISLWLIALAGASVLFSLLVLSPFLAGAVGQVENAAHYSVSFNPAVLSASFLKLTIEYSPWHTIAGVFVFIALGVFWKDRRRELFLLAAMVFCLILSYALISNSLSPYRVFAWLPWLSALVVVAAAVIWRGDIAVFSGRKTLKMIAVVPFLVPFLIGYLDRLPRLMVAGWYESAQRTNKLMLESIVANKSMLEREDVVGVLGVEGLSPWSNNDGAYLRKKLGFSNRWVVFLDKSTMFFTINESDPAAYLSVIPSMRLCEHPGLLVMKFDSSGTGKPLRAGELCTAGEDKK